MHHKKTHTAVTNKDSRKQRSIPSSPTKSASAMEGKENHLIFLPGPGISHIAPALKVGKLILSRNSSLSITYLLISDHRSHEDMHEPFQFHPNQRLRFLHHPEAETQANTSSEEIQKLTAMKDVENISKHIPEVRLAIHDIINNMKAHVVGLIVDMFCVCMIDVGGEFGIPSYAFYASSAAFLSFQLFFRRLRDEQGQDITEYRDSDQEFLIPGFVNPVPAKVMPSMMLDRNGGSEIVMTSVRQILRAKGIFINTFEEIDSTAIKALVDLDGGIPSIYPIGPVINLNPQLEQTDYSIIKWLDEQPPSSVVFLCFGSQGTFNEAQIEQLAHAIESCGYKFLWSLKSPNRATANEILPEGFLNRTAGKGKVIAWAPQAAVLSHPAVGGFVSHCGWNSILESVWFGIPIAAWPIAAEQQVNAFHIVVELGIATEIKMDYRGEANQQQQIVVEAEVIEGAIKRIMGEESSEMRRKIRELREKGFMSLMAGGSSDRYMERLVHDILANSRSN